MTATTTLDLDALERAATDLPTNVCHLVGDDDVVLCGALFAPAVHPSDAAPDPTASPCRGGCGKDRCAACAAEHALSTHTVT